MKEPRIDFSKIRAVTFDAGGTLIEPWPSVGHVYAAAARVHLGVAPDPGRLNLQFREAWKRKSDFDYSRGAWLELVRRSFEGICSEPGVFFDELYTRFGEPDAWQIYGDVRPCLEHLRELGLRLAVISNWDERLRPILARLELAEFFEKIVVSIDVGYTKPAPQIFTAALKTLGLEAHEVLHVGDSRREDLLGPQALGMPAQLLHRGASQTGDLGVLASLSELSVLFQGR